MLEYLPLYFLAFIWILFAVVQDLRTREISNWLNFSLIAFALVYRAFYSSYAGEWNFFLFGLGGFALFWVLAYLLYYARAFAGGDAKLLMGLGAILPFDSLWSYASISFVFLLFLFVLGAIYSLIYTIFLAFGNWKRFTRDFTSQFKAMKLGIYSGIVFVVVVCLLFVAFTKSYLFSLSIFGFLLIGTFLLVYTKAVEKSCFLRLVKPSMLTEGDWIISDIRVGKYVVKKTVHGLEKKDIELLRKHNKSIVVKYGIPFGPAFLLGLVAFLIAFYMFPQLLGYFGV